jgi:hypothetical protein
MNALWGVGGGKKMPVAGIPGPAAGAGAGIAHFLDGDPASRQLLKPIGP